MTSKSPIFNDFFWSVLNIINQSEEKNLKIEEVLEKLGLESIESEQLEGLANFLHKFEYQLEKCPDGKVKGFIPLSRPQDIGISLSIIEWAALNAIMSQFQGEKPGPYQVLENKLSQIFKVNPELNLSAFFQDILSKENIALNFSGDKKELLKMLEQSLQQSILVKIYCKENRQYEIYPHRLLYIEGQLALIGEDTKDRSLISVDLVDIKGVQSEENLDYVANYSSLEVDEFIFAVRSVLGNGERLILRIKSELSEEVNLNPDYHFLGHPYVTANSEGDLIWAASVEVSNELFQWLYQIKDQVEILDPESIKIDLDEYAYQRDCGEKKAS